MADWLQHTLTYATIFAVLSGISWATMRLRPNRRTPDGGRIVPSRLMIVPIAVLSFGLSAFGFYASAYANGGGAALGVGLGFGAGALLVSTAFASANDVTWTSESITGPASYGIWPFGPRRATIPFAAIVECGIDRFQSFFVLDKEGTKIRWNYYYAGFPALMEAIAKARPDLAPAQK